MSGLLRDSFTYFALYNHTFIIGSIKQKYKIGIASCHGIYSYIQICETHTSFHTLLLHCGHLNLSIMSRRVIEKGTVTTLKTAHIF